MNRFGVALAAALPLLGIVAAGQAPAADFYAGRQITVVIAAGAGGGFTAYGRTLAKHMPKYIPGNPTMVIKNMPGAGGRKATDWIDKIAPKDGATILGTQPGALVEPILGNPKRVKYKPLELSYIGSIAGFTTLCLVRADHKVQSFADLQKTQAVFGGDQLGSTTHDHANMMRNLAGARIKLVKGYSGTKTLVLAIQQKEIDGFCGYAWASLMSRAPHLVRDKVVNLVVQFGLKNHPAATKAGVPPVWDFVKDKKDADALRLLASVQVFGRPYIAPPGVPAERIATLRKAFDATMKDADFLAQMKKLRLDVTPTSGDQVQKLIKDIFLAPKETQKRARWAISKSS